MRIITRLIFLLEFAYFRCLVQSKWRSLMKCGICQTRRLVVKAYWYFCDLVHRKWTLATLLFRHKSSSPPPSPVWQKKIPLNSCPVLIGVLIFLLLLLINPDFVFWDPSDLSRSSTNWPLTNTSPNVGLLC